MSSSPKDLPLAILTPTSWATSSLTDLPALLSDHAHLERKAAQNALELALRWPEADAHEEWVKILSEVARDEVQHFRSVTRFLDELGYELTRHHRNSYAAKLRSTIRSQNALEGLVDRLLVSALIELRSCERFFLLAEAIERKKLAKFYRALWLSEHGHYLSFLELAYTILPEVTVKKRWKEYLQQEAEILLSESTGARMHSRW